MFYETLCVVELCLGNGKDALRMCHYSDAERQTGFSRRAGEASAFFLGFPIGIPSGKSFAS